MSDVDPDVIPAEMRIPAGEVVFHLRPRLNAGIETHEYRIRLYGYNPNDNTVTLSLTQHPYQNPGTHGEHDSAEDQHEVAESPSSPPSETLSSSSYATTEGKDGNGEDTAYPPRVTDQNASVVTTSRVPHASAAQDDDRIAPESSQNAMIEGPATRTRQRQLSGNPTSSAITSRARGKQPARRNAHNAPLRSIGLDPLDQRNVIEQRLRGSSKRKAPDFFTPDVPPAKRATKSKAKEPDKAAVEEPPKRPVKPPTKRTLRQTTRAEATQVTTEAGPSSLHTVTDTARSRDNSVASSVGSSKCDHVYVVFLGIAC